MYSASSPILIHSGSANYVMSCLHERQKCQQPAPMSHGYTVSRKDCLTAHRNHPCMFPLASVKNMKPISTKQLVWRPEMSRHVPVWRWKAPPSTTHIHFCLRVRTIRVLFFSLQLLPINLRQPRGVRKKACLSQPLQTQQACEEPR